jgi:hypothetical protein
MAARPLLEQSLILELFWLTPSELLYRRAKPGESGAMPIVSLNRDTGGEQEIARPEGVYWWYVTDAKGAEGMGIMDVASRESWPLCRDAVYTEFGKRLDNHVAWAPNGTFVVVGRREPTRYERLAWEGVTAEAVAKLMRSR